MAVFSLALAQAVALPSPIDMQIGWEVLGAKFWVQTSVYPTLSPVRDLFL